MNRIRPLVLAREWKAEPRKVIELCLEAARVGLLGMRWDLICPRCRGGEGAIPDLETLPEGVHCPSCNIDYQRDFSANVELSFHPAPAIRPINPDENFCLMSPAHTPHVLLQKYWTPAKARRSKSISCRAPMAFVRSSPAPSWKSIMTAAAFPK